MDTKTIERVIANIESTAARTGISLDELVIFGSRVRGDHRPRSDVDLLMVSPEFDGMPVYRRSKLFYRYWDYDTLPDPEFICLTPAEFEDRREKQPHIVRTALEEGISVA